MCPVLLRATLARHAHCSIRRFISQFWTQRAIGTQKYARLCISRQAEMWKRKPEEGRKYQKGKKILKLEAKAEAEAI